jgi:hypothetical protein
MSDYDPVEPYGVQARRRSWWRALILPGVAFLLGLGAMGYILGHWETGARALGIAPAPPPAAEPAPPPPVAALQPQAPAPAPPAAGGDSQPGNADPDIARRIAALEQRIGSVDTQSRAAVGNADRAEGLLVAFAARRALDRGVGLGFLETMLQQRFGQNQPNAVGRIIFASHNPVTLQDLQLGLQDAGPRLVGAAPDTGWWESLKAELGSMITVRREGTPSTEPSERLRRATQRLEAGQVEVALTEVMRIPARDNAADWIRKAQIYLAARDALDRIETAALVEQRPPPAAAPAPAAQQPAPRPAAARPPVARPARPR